jgi:competence protein ComEC
VIAEQGQILKFGDLELEILYPFEKLNGKKVEDLNNSSIVFRARYKNVKLLFLGDAEQEIGAKLLNLNFDIESDVLKIAHQGSKNGAQNLATFLDRVNPQIAVILVGENKYGHPHKETLENLEKKKIKTLRTDKDSKGGSIRIKSDGEKFWIQ